MTAAKVRVAKTEVELDTVPLALRHWVVFLCIVAAAITAWWVFYRQLPDAAPDPMHPVWIASKGDDFVRAEAIARSTNGQRAKVIAVGSSVVLENLSPDDELTKATGVGVVNLATSGQSVLESLYILHRQGLRAGQLVIVSVTPNEMAQPADIADERLTDGLWLHPPTAFAETFHQDIPKLDSWRSATARRAHTLAVQRQLLYRQLRGGVQRWGARYLYGNSAAVYKQYRHEDEPAGDLVNQERLRGFLRTGLVARWHDNHEENAQILGVLLRYVKSRGAHPVLLDPPRIEGDSLRTYGEYWQPFRDDVRAVADSNGVQIVDLNPALRLTADEFHDPVHLAPAGRARWTAAFVRLVSSLCSASPDGTADGCR